MLFLALGVRQDAGLFLFFLLLACLVAPRAWGDVSRPRVLVACAVCVVYVAVASKVIMPWFGNDGGTRFWRAWGDTWPQVFLSWFRDPARVMDAIDNSAFHAFNIELLYVPGLNPIAWVLSQAPGVLFYTADAFDKQHLMFYNAAFLLPGLMLCFSFAQLHALTFALWITRERGRTRQIAIGIVGALFAYVALASALSTPRDASETLEVGTLQRRDPFAFSPLRQLAACRNVHSVATDFRGIVYAPLRLDKYLTEKATLADLVVVSRHPDKHAPFFIKPKRLVRNLEQNGHYALAGSYNEYDFYLNTRVDCPHAQASR
jgi:hypothetical protein